MISKKEIRHLYGRDAAISRKGRFVLVHLDGPSKAVVQARTRTFQPNEFFHKDCPVCQMQRDAGIFVFDALYEVQDLDDPE